MENVVNISLTCTKCGHSFQTVSYPGINTDRNPELKDKVLDGSLFLAECPHCSQKVLNTVETLYHDPSSRLMVWLTRSAMAQAQGKALYEANEALHDYTLRLVAGIGDLIEKVKIFETGLNDVVIEMCKYITRQEIGKPDAELRFCGMGGSEGELTFTYPENGQMQMLSVGLNVYEDCRGIIARNPAIKEQATGFVQVDRQWLEKYFG